jgi:hypothetical protein
MNIEQNTNLKSKLRWFHVTPGCLLVVLLAIEGILLLSEKFHWFAFDEIKNSTIAVAAVGLFLLVMFTWFIGSLIFRWPFQFSIRSLLILTIAIAIPSSWLAVEMQQSEAVYAIQDAGGMMLCDPKIMGRPLVGVELYSPLKDDGWIDAIKKLPSLKTLVLSGEDITDETLDHLADLPNIEELQLTSRLVTDQGLKNLSKFPKLRLLSMSHALSITDSGLVHVKKLKYLEELILFCTDISDAAIPNLSEMTSLKMLDVERTAITANGWNELKKVLPNCNVMWKAK